MKIQNFALIMFLFAIVFIATKVDAKVNSPLKIKIIENPDALAAGQSYSFVFEIKNISGEPLILSSQCGASVTFFWMNIDGSGGGTGWGCSIGGGNTSTDYDPKTGKFSCITRVYTYTESDFFALQPNETRIFKSETTVPKDIPTKFVYVSVNYNSQYDGSEVGIHAWKGTASKSLKLQLRN